MRHSVAYPGARDGRPVHYFAGALLHPRDTLESRPQAEETFAGEHRFGTDAVWVGFEKQTT